MTVKEMALLTVACYIMFASGGRCARFYNRFRMEGAKEAILVRDWPNSEVYSIMIQARGLLELKGIRKFSFGSQF